MTGRPVPAGVVGADRAAARARLGLATGERCLLVFGGSQGARSVNFAALEAFAERPGREFRVLHLSGHRDHQQLAARLAAAPYGEGYELRPYDSELGPLLAACDLVVGRSGGSVFEVIAAGRPSILVPYPHATANHQTANAEWMRAQGAATVIADAELDAVRLAAEVESLFAAPAQLEAMAAAARRSARPEAARTIADRVLEAAHE